MSAVAALEERVLFSPSVPEAVNRLLQTAVAASHVDKPRAEQLFKQAQQLDGSCLQVYFALYKFYFYQGRLSEAEREVLAALDEAARQGELPGDYRQLAQAPHRWDMYASDTRLFYLYSLKALAFINLRLEREGEARAILVLLQTLDAEDRVGWSVIMSLADALSEEAV